MLLTRALAFLSLAMMALVATVGTVSTTMHPWLTPGALWLGVALTVVLCGMAMARSFFLDIVVIMYVTFYVQRIIVVYFLPDRLDFQDYLLISPEALTRATAFTLATAIATWGGFTVGNWKRPAETDPAQDLDSFGVLGRPVAFDDVFRWYATIAIPLDLYQLFLRVTEGIGVAGIEFARAFAIAYRISFFADSLGFLAIIMLLKRGGRPGLRRAAMALLALQVLLPVLHTSKGAVLSVLLTVVICAHFIGRPLKLKVVVASIVAIVLTVSLFPVMTALRTTAEGVFSDVGTWGDVAGVLAEQAQFATMRETMLEVSRRFESFDLLVGFLTVGRDAFPSWVSLKGELLWILNSLVPGDIVDTSDWISLNALILIMMRGFATVPSLAGNRDVEGFAGMAYLHYGLIGAPVFFFVWAWLSTVVLHARQWSNAALKILYFQLFVLSIFAAGGLANETARFYEGLITLALITWLATLTARRRNMGAPTRPSRALGVRRAPFTASPVPLMRSRAEGPRDAR